jgi:hypothetical protein
VETSSDEFLTTPEAAAFTRYAVSTLNALRVRGNGPRFIRLGRKIVYSKADLLAFMHENRCGSTAAGSVFAVAAQ